MTNDAPCAALRTANHFSGMARGNRLVAARHGQHGFTLIELLVALGVFAILAAVALPSYRSLMMGQRVKNASFDTMSALARARSEAIMRNANVDVTPNGGNWLNGWTVAVGGTVLYNQSALGNGLAVTCYSGAAPVACRAITYAGSGRLLPGVAPQSILIASSDASTPAGFASRCIGVDPSGRPRSQKGTGPCT